MASIQGGLLLTQVARPHQLRIALNAARNNLRAAALIPGREAHLAWSLYGPTGTPDAERGPRS